MNGLRFDEFGNVVKSKVFIVWGSPASGKTTYVRNNMSLGDLVVDLDNIKQAISMADKTSASDHLLPVALQLRELLYQLIEQRNIECDNVWIVAGLPQKEEREQLRVRLDAELIFIDTSKEECINRAMNDKERKDKNIQMQIIEKWFKKYYYD
jgi:predicted kinase